MCCLCTFVHLRPFCVHTTKSVRPTRILVYQLIKSLIFKNVIEENFCGVVNTRRAFGQVWQTLLEGLGSKSCPGLKHLP